MNRLAKPDPGERAHTTGLLGRLRIDKCAAARDRT